MGRLGKAIPRFAKIVRFVNHAVEFKSSRVLSEKGEAFQQQQQKNERVCSTTVYSVAREWSITTYT